MMFKSSLLVSLILAAGATACHHDRPAATPAEPTTTGMTATPEPGNTTAQNNSYNTTSPGATGATLPSTEDPNRTLPGGKEPLINDLDRTANPGASGSGMPTRNGSDTGSGMNPSDPDTTFPTSAQDTGSGANTGNGSNTARNRGKTSGPRSGSNGNGSADGSGSGSDVPR